MRINCRAVIPAPSIGVCFLVIKDALIHISLNSEETDNENTSEAELRDKIRMLEAITVPLLNNLLKTADKDYIFWPNRGPTIEKKLQKVLEITRGK